MSQRIWHLDMVDGEVAVNATICPDLFVVETISNWFIGTVEVLDDKHVTVYTGYAGRPPVIHVDDIESIILASLHNRVEAQ